MIPYNSFRYIYPPRPENALPADSLKRYDNGEYIAQPKFNGDCTVLFTNGIVAHVYNRHKEQFKKPLKIWDGTRPFVVDDGSGAKPPIKTGWTSLHRETLNGVNNKWMILVGEYMAKSKNNERGERWNDKFVIFDIIAYDGMQLIGKTFRERIELLDKLYGKEESIITETGVEKLNFMYATTTKNVFRVKSYFDCFRGLWDTLVKLTPGTAGMYEGLVLKRADAKLENGASEKNNTTSQLKFRKSTKNYRH